MDVGAEQSKLIRGILGSIMWKPIFKVIDDGTNGGLRGLVHNNTWDVIEDSTNNFCELKIVKKHESR